MSGRYPSVRSAWWPTRSASISGPPASGGYCSAPSARGDTVPGDLEFRVTEALLAHVEDLCVEGRGGAGAGGPALGRPVHAGLPASPRPPGGRASVAGDRTRRLSAGVAAARPARAAPGPARGTPVPARSAGRRRGADDGRAWCSAERPARVWWPISAGASGNPLFVTELLAAADRSGDLVTQPEGSVELGADARPSPLSVLVLHRLSLLPADTLETLRLAAVLGSHLLRADLCRVMGLPPRKQPGGCGPAQVGGVLADSGDRFRFRHEVIREALYHDTPEPLRRNLHLQVARTLTGTAPPEQVAEQLLWAASPAHPEVADDLRTVAAELAGRAPGLAADALGRAVEVYVRPAAEREDLRAERAQALWRSGRLEEAEATCRALLRRRPDPWVRLWLIQVLIARDRLEEAAPVIEEGLAAEHAAGGRPGSADGLGGVGPAACRRRAGGRRRPGGTGGAGRHGGRRPLRPHRCADDAGGRGQPAGPVRGSDRARRAGAGPRVRGRDRRASTSRSTCSRPTFLFDAGRPDEGHSAVKRAFADCDERGARWELPYCHRLAALGWFLAGRWDDALVELEAAAALAEELGTRRGDGPGLRHDGVHRPAPFRLPRGHDGLGPGRSGAGAVRSAAAA